MVLGEPLCHIGLVYWRKFFMAKSCSAPFVQKKAINRDLIQTFPKNSQSSWQEAYQKWFNLIDGGSASTNDMSRASPCGRS